MVVVVPVLVFVVRVREELDDAVDVGCAVSGVVVLVVWEDGGTVVAVDVVVVLLVVVRVVVVVADVVTDVVADAVTDVVADVVPVVDVVPEVVAVVVPVVDVSVVVAEVDTVALVVWVVVCVVVPDVVGVVSPQNWNLPCANASVIAFKVSATAWQVEVLVRSAPRQHLISVASPPGPLN